MPIVASQGGNAGTQTMTVAVRALATRDLGALEHGPRHPARDRGRPPQRRRLRPDHGGFGRRCGSRNTGLGIVIGLAMVANLLAAALGGILIPLALDRAGADPAVSSGTFVTTVTDVVGFFAFLGIATLWFGLS